MIFKLGSAGHYSSWHDSSEGMARWDLQAPFRPEQFCFYPIYILELGVIFICETGFSCTAQKVATNLLAVPCSINNYGKQLGDGAKGLKPSFTDRIPWSNRCGEYCM